MEEGKSYIPPVKLGQVMRSMGVGEVLESNHPNFKQGDVVSGNLFLIENKIKRCFWMAKICNS